MRIFYLYDDEKDPGCKRIEKHQRNVKCHPVSVADLGLEIYI